MSKAKTGSPNIETTSVGSPDKLKVARDERGRLMPGSANLNPGGRPKGLALRIRELTNNLSDQINRMVAISQGEVKAASVRDQIEATKWLAERSFGKAPETHLVGAMGEEQRDAVAELTRDQLLALVETTLDTVLLPSQTTIDIEPTE